MESVKKVIIGWKNWIRLLPIPLFVMLASCGNLRSDAVGTLEDVTDAMKSAVVVVQNMCDPVVALCVAQGKGQRCDAATKCYEKRAEIAKSLGIGVSAALRMLDMVRSLP